MSFEHEFPNFSLIEFSYLGSFSFMHIFQMDSSDRLRNKVFVRFGHNHWRKSKHVKNHTNSWTLRFPVWTLLQMYIAWITWGEKTLHWTFIELYKKSLFVHFQRRSCRIVKVELYYGLVFRKEGWISPEIIISDNQIRSGVDIRKFLRNFTYEQDE